MGITLLLAGTIVVGVIIIALMVLIPQAPSRKQKGNAILSPLNDILTDPVTSGIIFSFDFTSGVNGFYLNRAVCARVDFGKRGMPGRLHLTMEGLSPFSKLPLFIADYPKMEGDVVHKGKVIELECPLSDYDRDFYRSALDQLTAAAEKLEKS